MTEPKPPSPNSYSRREFLKRAQTTAAATMIGVAALDAAGRADDVGPLTPRQRRDAAWLVRHHAADEEWRTGIVEHRDNGDEERYPHKIGSYSKGLQHDPDGEVNLISYHSLMRALRTGQQYDYEHILLGGPRKLVDPQSGTAFDLEGPDSHALTMPPPPTVASAEEAGEIVESYWMALLRDVPFPQWETDPGIAAAAEDLNKLSVFKGPRGAQNQVDAGTIFRGNSDFGDLTGPIVSQFLWQDIPYGAELISQAMLYHTPGVDYLTDFPNWLAVQNGGPTASTPIAPVRRYPCTMRDLASWVHVDALYQGYLNACLILLGQNAPPNPGNPYLTSTTQVGFGTFGAPHILSLVCEAATRALKAVWYQKWNVHRRIRPECFGSLVHLKMTGLKDYPIHPDVLNAAVLPRVFDYNAAQNAVRGANLGTYLLPQAFSEGSPTHPAYGAGHATVAGACVTILKAWFDETWALPSPRVATADGSRLVDYTGPEALTVGGELNKVAANIGLARDMAGVHWRSDYWQSLLLGEKVGIGILRDQKWTFNEPSALQFTGFRGNAITI